MKTIKGPSVKNPIHAGMEDVSAGVVCFFKIVEASDELEAFLGRHASVNGTGAINISISDPGIASELAVLINALQKALVPYREGKQLAEASSIARN